MRSRMPRPSPALVVASIALFVALGGTGYAAATGSIDTREIKNSTIRGKDVKNKSLTGGDIQGNSVTGTQVSEGKLGKVPSAGRADSANSANAAATAGNGVKAYGSVTSAGAVIAAKSSGITVTPESAGVYCVKANGVTSATRTLIATPDLGDGSGINHTVQYDARPGACTNGGGWRVLTLNAGAVTPVAFAVMVP